MRKARDLVINDPAYSSSLVLNHKDFSHARPLRVSL